MSREGSFIPRTKLPLKYFFSADEIENSLKECKSVSAAARHLRIDYRAMKKFADFHCANAKITLHFIKFLTMPHC